MVNAVKLWLSLQKFVYYTKTCKTNSPETCSTKIHVTGDPAIDKHLRRKP